MSRRSHTFNGYQSTLPNPITAGQDVIGVSTVAGLQAPGKLVIDHDLPATREWFSFAGISGLNLTGCVRGLAGASGSGGGVAHAQGAIVQAVPMHQHFDDLWDDLDDVVSAATTHLSDVNPHPGYATDGELATTNAQVAIHTTEIGVLQATDVVLADDITNLEAADTLHFASTNGHPVATVTTDGFISAADKVKLDRIGTHCVVSTSTTQVYGDASAHFIVFDVENYDPVGIHTDSSSLFTIPYTGIWFCRFRNTAAVVFDRPVGLRVGSTPGSGNLFPLNEGRDLGTGGAVGDPGQNTYMSGPMRIDAGTQIRLEANELVGSGTSVAGGSNLTLAYGSNI